MASSPQYTARTISAVAALSTANANRDGATGTYVTAYTFTAAASGGLGGRIDYLTVKGLVTTTAGMVRMFVNNFLVAEIIITAITASATVPAFAIPTTLGADGLGRLPIGMVCQPGDVVKFSTEKAEAITCRIEGGEF